MTTLRNKRKLTAVLRETPENTRNNQSPNAVNPGRGEEYITQVSQEIEGWVTKEFSQEVSRTVVYKQAYDTSRGGRTPSHTASNFPYKPYFSEKTQDARRKKLYYVNGGTQERKCNLIKIFFHLYVNRNTQERRYNFIKIISHLKINMIS